MGSPNEGNEVRREGRPGVGASPSNGEAGELDRRTPRSEGDAVSNDRWRETGRVHRNPGTCPRNTNGERNSRGKARRWDSRPWLPSSTSTGSVRLIGVHARTGRWAWTDRTARTTR